MRLGRLSDLLWYVGQSGRVHEVLCYSAASHCEGVAMY